MSESDTVGKGDAPPPYVLFVVVFLFFITGLLGFLVCHMLKKKGYHCRTGDLDDEEDEEEGLKANAEDEDEENQDTVEQILKCIIENEANMEALNEMLGNQNVCVHHDPRVRKESLAGIPPHHHTVHSGGNINSCHLCAQVRSKKGRRQSKTPRFKQRPGEQTVLSVGRFRVTHTDKKLHGGSNSLAESGNQLDQSQDSDDRKEAGYNLRSMFKDVQPFSQASNGPAQNSGKRRRSLTIFGLRRGSDATGTRLNDGASKEIGLGRFGVQQQPVVLEEPLPSERRGGSRTPPPPEASGSTPSSRGDVPVNDPEEPPALDPPKTLTIPLTAESQKTLTATNKGDAMDDRGEEVCDPGPQQTSTPISFEPGLETAPGLSMSSDVEPGFDANLTLSRSSLPPQNNLATSLTPVTSSRNPPLDEKLTDFLETTLIPQSPASTSSQFVKLTPGSKSKSVTCEENTMQQHQTPGVAMSEMNRANRAAAVVESTLPHQPTDNSTPPSVTSNSDRTSPGTIREFDVVPIPDEGESKEKPGKSVGRCSPDVNCGGR